MHYCLSFWRAEVFDFLVGAASEEDVAGRFVFRVREAGSEEDSGRGFWGGFWYVGWRRVHDGGRGYLCGRCGWFRLDEAEWMWSWAMAGKWWKQE